MGACVWRRERRQATSASPMGCQAARAMGEANKTPPMRRVRGLARIRRRRVCEQASCAADVCNRAPSSMQSPTLNSRRCFSGGHPALAR